MPSRTPVDHQPVWTLSGIGETRIHCGFSALVVAPTALIIGSSKVKQLTESRSNKGRTVKKVALALALVVAGLSLGGCFVGKGKAPAPVITKG
jgi:hypothetical protein